jgi:hypothetical protein
MEVVVAKNAYYRIDAILTGFCITKCDEDLNFVECYEIVKERERWFCSCPNTLAPVCRHQKMINIFMSKKAIGKAMFYCYDTGEWIKVKEFN